MSCPGHTFGRARRGHRTGLWMRTCLDCGVTIASAEEPAQPPPVTARQHRIEVEPQMPIRQRMERLVNRWRGAWLERIRGAHDPTQ